MTYLFHWKQTVCKNISWARRYWLPKNNNSVSEPLQIGSSTVVVRVDRSLCLCYGTTFINSDFVQYRRFTGSLHCVLAQQDPTTSRYTRSCVTWLGNKRLVNLSPQCKHRDPTRNYHGGPGWLAIWRSSETGLMFFEVDISELKKYIYKRSVLIEKVGHKHYRFKFPSDSEHWAS